MSAFTRAMNTFARGIVRLVFDGLRAQEVQASLTDGETHEDLQRLQPYGFHSSPPVGTECLAVFIGGNRDHGLVVGEVFRAASARNLASGEVLVFNALTGATARLKADGSIDVTPAPGQSVNVLGPLAIAGNVTVTGSLTASGNVSDVNGSMQEMRGYYNTHTHGGGATPSPQMT